jgi:hypothetical protein
MSAEIVPQDYKASNRDDSMAKWEACNKEILEIVRFRAESRFRLGELLWQVKEEHLYKNNRAYKKFEDYCHAITDFSRRYVDELMLAACAKTNIERGYELGQFTQDASKWNTIPKVLPTNARQLHSLLRLVPEDQVRVWCAAVELAGGKVPTESQVSTAVTNLGLASDKKQKSVGDKKASDKKASSKGQDDIDQDVDLSLPTDKPAGTPPSDVSAPITHNTGETPDETPDTSTGSPEPAGTTTSPIKIGQASDQQSELSDTQTSTTATSPTSTTSTATTPPVKPEPEPHTDRSQPSESPDAYVTSTGVSIATIVDQVCALEREDGPDRDYICGFADVISVKLSEDSRAQIAYGLVYNLPDTMVGELVGDMACEIQSESLRVQILTKLLDTLSTESIQILGKQGVAIIKNRKSVATPSSGN